VEWGYHTITKNERLKSQATPGGLFAFFTIWFDKVELWAGRGLRLQFSSVALLSAWLFEMKLLVLCNYKKKDISRRISTLFSAIHN